MADKTKVVAIDDDLEFCIFLKSVLDGTGDFEVTALSRPKEAEQVIRQIMPDIILLDIVMPDRKGTEIIAALKKEKELRRIPIVVVSGKGEMIFEPKKKAFQWLPNNPLALKERPNIPPARGAASFAEAYGVDDYVSKPFSPEVLIQVLQDVLARRPANREEGSSEEGLV